MKRACVVQGRQRHNPNLSGALFVCRGHRTPPERSSLRLLPLAVGASQAAAMAEVLFRMQMDDGLNKDMVRVCPSNNATLLGIDNFPSLLSSKKQCLIILEAVRETPTPSTMLLPLAVIRTGGTQRAGTIRMSWIWISTTDLWRLWRRTKVRRRVTRCPASGAIARCPWVTYCWESLRRILRSVTPLRSSGGWTRAVSCRAVLSGIKCGSESAAREATR
jgi:hypothetical protein